MNFFHSERHDDGSVTYTGFLPALIALTVIICITAACLIACIWAIRAVIEALG